MGITCGLAAILLVLAIQVIEGAKTRGNILQDHDIYTASWVVEIMEGGEQTADDIAAQHCFNNIGKLKVWLTVTES